MKKTRRILALCGAILLLCMYAATIITAIFSPEGSMNFLMATLLATIIVPVLLWAYGLVYRLVKPETEEAEEAEAVNGTVEVEATEKEK